MRARLVAAVLALALAVAGPAGTAAAQHVIARRTTLTLRGTPHHLVFSFEKGRARRLDSGFETTVGHGIHRESASTARMAPVSEELCETPCTAEVDVGVYFLRVGVPGHGDASVGEVLLRPGPHTLVAHFASRADARLVGAVLLVPGLLGLTVSLLLVLAGPEAWIAVALSAVLAGVSLGLVTLGDDAGIVADP